MLYIRAFYDIQKHSIVSAFVNISPSTPTRELPQRRLFFCPRGQYHASVHPLNIFVAARTVEGLMR